MNNNTFTQYIQFKGILQQDHLDYFEHIKENIYPQIIKFICEFVGKDRLDSADLELIHSNSYETKYLSIGKKDKHIIFDISTCLLISNQMDFLINGNYSGLREGVLKYLACYFESNKDYHSSVKFSLCSSFMFEALDFDEDNCLVFMTENDQIFDNISKVKVIKSDNPSRIIEKGMEFFTLAHEVVHSYYNKEYNIEDSIFAVQNILDDSKISNKLIQQWELFLNYKNNSETSNNSIFSDSLLEEVYCDILASYMTWKYFTQENLKHHFDILRVIDYTMQSLVSLTKVNIDIKNMISGKDAGQELLIEIKIRAMLVHFFLKDMSKNISYDSQDYDKDVFIYSLHPELLQNRIDICNECYSKHLLPCLKKIKEKDLDFLNYISYSQRHKIIKENNINIDSLDIFDSNFEIPESVKSLDNNTYLEKLSFTFNNYDLENSANDLSNDDNIMIDPELYIYLQNNLSDEFPEMFFLKFCNREIAEL